MTPQSHNYQMNFHCVSVRHSPNDFITIDVDSINPKDEHTQKREKGIFSRILPGFRNIVAFWKVPRIRTFDLLVRDVHSTLVE